MIGEISRLTISLDSDLGRPRFLVEKHGMIRPRSRSLVSCDRFRALGSVRLARGRIVAHGAS
jgi:hypothetical protein